MDKNAISLGLQIGRILAGQRRKSVPVAYLYNGIRLPKLPEWNKETYPHSFIRVLGAYYVLVLSDVYGFEEHKTAGTWCVTYSENYVNYRAKTASFFPTVEMSKNWELCEQQDISSCAVGNVRWANFDILNEDGSVYIAASEPVPVYE